jgi:hypothetical protein
LSRADFIYQFTFIITISRMRSGFLSCALPAFGGRAPCCRFAFRKSPAVCLRYRKTKGCFFLPDVFRFGLDVKNT